MKLSEIKTGETFTTGNIEHIVLEHFEEGSTACISLPIVKDMQFDKITGNYANSEIRRYLNKEFYTALAEKVGAENILEHNVDLKSDDGRSDYGFVTDKVDLITTNRYRRYIEIFDKYNPDEWWWTATPLSTKKWNSCVRIVSNSGVLSSCGSCNNGGVRPFYILKSSISVS